MTGAERLALSKCLPLLSTTHRFLQRSLKGAFVFLCNLLRSSDSFFSVISSYRHHLSCWVLLLFLLEYQGPFTPTSAFSGSIVHLHQPQQNAMHWGVLTAVAPKALKAVTFKTMRLTWDRHQVADRQARQRAVRVKSDIAFRSTGRHSHHGLTVLKDVLITTVSMGLKFQYGFQRGRKQQ